MKCGYPKKLCSFLLLLQIEFSGGYFNTHVL